jgi:nicotinate-nucleotide pyrophosphorylase (carboxylating)
MAERRVVLEEKLRGFLAEDIGYGDATSDSLIPANEKAHARLFYREPGVAAGLLEASIVFELLGCKVKLHAKDGDRVPAKKVLLEADGDARALLAGERTALNIVTHMAGIATATARVVEACGKINPATRVAATRKTLPGLRDLEKHAVELGGGDPHRIRLDDCLLIKDNHLELVPSVSEAVRQARQRCSFTKKIEVETETLEQAAEAAEAGADIIMLDNRSPDEVRTILKELERRGLRKGHTFEASGGITEENAAEYAATGVDVISLGALTHSVKALDVKLEVRLAGRSKA